MFPVRRQRIYTKNHLPVTFFIMHFRFFIHFVCQIFLIRHHTVHEGDQLLFFKHQPEMIFIKSKSLFKFFFCCRFCCRETRCLHTGNFFQITQICCSYSHLYSPSFPEIPVPHPGYPAFRNPGCGTRYISYRLLWQLLHR